MQSLFGGHGHSHGPGGHSHTHSHHQMPNHFQGGGDVRAIPRLLGLVVPECGLIIIATLALIISAGINLLLVRTVLVSLCNDKPR
jgi:hypothetical protein